MLTCDDASQHKVINTALYYIYTIMYAIAKYWPQLVKQAPKLWTRLFIETIGPLSSNLGLLILLS